MATVFAWLAKSTGRLIRQALGVQQSAAAAFIAAECSGLRVGIDVGSELAHEFCPARGMPTGKCQCASASLPDVWRGRCGCCRGRSVAPGQSRMREVIRLLNGRLFPLVFPFFRSIPAHKNAQHSLRLPNRCLDLGTSFRQTSQATSSDSVRLSLVAISPPSHH